MASDLGLYCLPMTGVQVRMANYTGGLINDCSPGPGGFEYIMSLPIIVGKHF